MARIRTIKPETPQSESLGRVSRDARLLFLMLFTICDDDGRARASSRLLASLLFPYDVDAPALIEGWLVELDAVTAIVRYTVDGSNYLEVVNFKKHQKIDRPSPSKLPAPRTGSRAITEGSRGITVGSGSGRDLDLDLGRDLDQDRDLDLDRGQGALATARDAVPPVFRHSSNPHHNPDGLINGSAIRRHGTHAWCSRQRDGLCVPQFLHEEFGGKLGPPDAARRLLAWYPTVLAPFEGQAIGDDSLVFWRHQFAAWVGTVTSAPANTRERRTLAASARTGAAIARGEL